MATIIRATEHNRSVHQPQFNFEDMAAQAGQYLDKVRAEAAQIIAVARKDAETIRKQAEVDGKASAQKAIHDLARQQMTQQTATLFPALRAVIQQLQQAKQSWLMHWERAGVHVATAIAQKIIRREVAQEPSISMRLLREALELAAGHTELRIRLNSHDHRVLGDEAQSLIKELNPMAAAEVIADAEVSAGGCVVETRFGTIDQQIESQLARIEEELT
jgi:flagellar assembly protein FliH